jgi:GntR family transcriptional regulator
VRGLEVDPASSTPIWSQIEEAVRRLVASGALAAGAPIPSVRDLARDLRVNPATVAKAYQRLADQGVLVVRRGEGTFVAENPPTFSRGERERLLQDGAGRYASLAATIGASRSEASEKLRDAFERLDGGGQRTRRSP